MIQQLRGELKQIDIFASFHSRKPQDAQMQKKQQARQAGIEMTSKDKLFRTTRMEIQLFKNTRTQDRKPRICILVKTESIVQLRTIYTCDQVPTTLAFN